MTIRAAMFTYLGLMVLLAITVASTLVPLGPGNSLINLAIAALLSAGVLTLVAYISGGTDTSAFAAAVTGVIAGMVIRFARPGRRRR